jgi:hypothetical protein
MVMGKHPPSECVIPTLYGPAARRKFGPTMNARNQAARQGNPFKGAGKLEDAAPGIWKSRAAASGDRSAPLESGLSRLRLRGAVEPIASGMVQRQLPDPAA